MADGPLAGVRIVDLTHVWAGPLAIRTLSDLGAEIVKIERPTGRGPRQSAIEPIGGWLGGEPAGEPWNRNAVFVKLARNSKSVCIDLKKEAGREVFLELVAVADVVVENFSARAMGDLDLAYPELARANPNIIYVTSPGFGSYGPYRDWVAFGPSVEPMTGLTTVFGYSEDEPRNTAVALVDPMAGTSIAAAIVSALRHREREGRGARVEMSLHESGVSFHGPWLVEEQMGGAIRPLGNRHPQMSPHGIYRCSGEDEWVAIACPDEATWRGLCACIETLDVDLDLAQRRTDEDAIDQSIEAWTCERSKETVALELQARGVPAGPVNTTPEMVADPQVRAREFFVPYERFATPMPGNPIKMAGISSDQWTRCPKLGEHNREVLEEWLDYDPKRIEALLAAEVLLDKPPA